jgi:hypothetical protein
MYSDFFLKEWFMDIQSWFSSQGSYADGLTANCLLAMLI